MIKALNQEKIKLFGGIGLAYIALRSLLGLTDDDAQFFPLLFNNIWRTMYVLVLNYILFEYTFKFFRLNGFKIIAGIFLLFFHLLFYSFGLYIWTRLGIFLHIYTQLTVYKEIEENLEAQMGFSVGSIFFFGIVRHIYYYQKLKNTAQKLQIEKQEAELNFLKSQTNPHFLFNTLNNIYSLARDKSDLAPESILRLSKILRYMLYETAGEFIAIEQELKIMDDYLALEKLRYDETLRINFNYDIEDMRQALPPLLLIPLVENAFKHGVSETRGEPFVNIHLSVRQRNLKLIVKNSCDNSGEDFKIKEKIGLSNLKRQLELLFKEYELIIQPTENEFIAILKINLASYG
jgi:two-component system, LytTR family, sensor kinase